jgi:hypothetical protein
MSGKKISHLDVLHGKYDMTHTHRLTHLGSISASTNKYPALISHEGQQSTLPSLPPISVPYCCHSNNNLAINLPFNTKTWEIFPHVLGLGTAYTLHNKFTKRGVRRYTFINLSLLDIKNREIIPKVNFKNSHGLFSQEGN